MSSNIEEIYDKLPIHLNSAIKKLFYCISRGVKNGRNPKIAKISYFFWFLSLHNLLERACNHIKHKICSESALGNVSRNNIFNYWKIPWNFQNWPKWKILYFLRNWHPRNPCATLWKLLKPIALQVWCPAFTKNFEWLANETVLGQNSLNSFVGEICKNL